MADEIIKISGGDASGKILKIPKGSSYPVQFKPEFNKEPTEKDFENLLNGGLSLTIEDLAQGSDNEPVIPPVRAGQDFIFTLDTTESRYVQGTVYMAKILLRKTSPEAAIAEGAIANQDQFEVLSEFVFQVVSNEVDNAPNTLFSVLQSLPDDLKNLKDLRVGLKRTEREEGPDVALWRAVKARGAAVSFKEYQKFMDAICGGAYEDYSPDPNLGFSKDKLNEEVKSLERKRFTAFADTDSYRTVKVLTEAYLLTACSTDLTSFPKYSEETRPGEVSTIPFLKIIRDKLKDLQLKPKSFGDVLEAFRDGDVTSELGGSNMEDGFCFGILQDSLTNPCFIELIWSYWHEESMLIQSMKAITRRFQNVRGPKKRDPLAGMEIAPLRPLNNLLWGYIQDEQHRLTVQRRAYEYDHHYGFSLQGKAIRPLRSVDSRVNFLEAFHNLLHLCSKFYVQEDDTTKVPDGYPILTALRETHLLLTQGMHNQYGDLPFTARVEMMMQQWMLARPEFREFLPTRTMTAYPEPWMDRVAAMNHLQGWTATSPVSFSYLGIYGETILLSIRFGNWSDAAANSEMASFWASFFRNEIQGYIHAYRVATGVDLTTTNPQTGKIDFNSPSIHLMNRLRTQRRNAS